MKRTISLLGRPVVLEDRDGSRYLESLPGFFEPDVLAVFSAVCSPDFNVVDVGANIGLTAISLARLCARGRVFAIEPMPATFQYLCKNVARAYPGNVTCENMAASAVPGEVEISHPADFSAGAFVSEKYDRGENGMVRHRVPACPVDDYLDRVGAERIDFIKIDVEGYELEVLRGARRTIERWQPMVFCEVNHFCLNIFHRICLPDFMEEVLSICPHVFAIGADVEVLDLSQPASLHRFYHEHTVRMAYPNILCGFDKAALAAKLEWLPQLFQLELGRAELQAERAALAAERVALRLERDAQTSEFALQRSQFERDMNALRAERDAVVNSRSWRYAAPLRQLRALGRRVVSRNLGA